MPVRWLPPPVAIVERAVDEARCADARSFYRVGGAAFTRAADGMPAVVVGRRGLRGHAGAACGDETDTHTWRLLHAPPLPLSTRTYLGRVHERWDDVVACSLQAAAASVERQKNTHAAVAAGRRTSPIAPSSPAAAASETRSSRLGRIVEEVRRRGPATCGPCT